MWQKKIFINTSFHDDLLLSFIKHALTNLEQTLKLLKLITEVYWESTMKKVSLSHVMPVD